MCSIYIADSKRSQGAAKHDDKRNPTSLRCQTRLSNRIEETALENRDAKADVAVWDFGGQFVFYTTHQMFLTYRGFYLLVLDIRNDLDDDILDGDLLGVDTQCTVKGRFTCLYNFGLI
jgi:GTPase SAR1 family protein